MTVPFTDADLDLIRARYAHDGGAGLAKALPHHTAGRIAAKARRMGLRFTPHASWKTRSNAHRWTPEEDQTLRLLWPLVRRRERTAASVAEQLGVSEGVVRYRADLMGLRLTRLNASRAWTPEEDEYVAQHSYLGMATLQKRMAKHGWIRTKSAISIRLARLGISIRHHTEAYSAHQLAQLMGVSHNMVRRWVNQKWLKARPRTEAVVASTGGPGDQWLIYPKDVRTFIIEHPAQVDISRVDRFWFIDLLADDARPVKIQHSAGIAESGLTEMQVAA